MLNQQTDFFIELISIKSFQRTHFQPELSIPHEIRICTSGHKIFGVSRGVSYKKCDATTLKKLYSPALKEAVMKIIEYSTTIIICNLLRGIQESANNRGPM